MLAKRPFTSRAWLFLSLVGFAIGSFNIYKGLQYASAVPTEKTTKADNASITVYYQTLFSFKVFKGYRCTYDFFIEGVSYKIFSGHETCSIPDTDDSMNGDATDTNMVISRPNATVYYDPANPSTNSLIDFGATSKGYYRAARLSIGFALFINLPLVFLMAYNSIKKEGHRGIVIDAGGTVIYPEDFDFVSALGGIPSENTEKEEPYTGANGEPANIAESTPSPWLRELYLEVVKTIHPDHASNEADRALRERLTKDANAAFKQRDDATLRRVMEDYKEQSIN